MEWQGLHQEAVKNTMRGEEREEDLEVREDHSSMDSMGRWLSGGVLLSASGTVPFGPLSIFWSLTSFGPPQVGWSPLLQFPEASQQPPEGGGGDAEGERRPALRRRSRNHFIPNIRRGRIAEYGMQHPPMQI
ncbi:hypothetical protein TrRE_jg2710 [Triparma retinervis]|uniref:Uncharacterized protein n=1 Tax=Triparma retinervis TaxID=2557542 RepID=A0A9W6ZW54_9STRA|nr:hypothetical protein TrRE_jg2710 [Triparma retinervis]